MIRALLVAMAVAVLTGCVALPGRTLPSAKPFPLAPLPESLPASATQTLNAAFGNQEIALQCAFAKDGSGWKTVCIGPAGRRVLGLNVDAQQQVTAQLDPSVPANFDPNRMAVDIQWAFWPLDALTSATTGTEWRIAQPTPATRRIYNGERLIAEVHYADADPWNGRLWISNYALGYSLYLVTQSAGAGHVP